MRETHDLHRSKRSVDQIYMSEVSFMFWKMINLQLKKGFIFPSYGDSAPFLRVICHKHTQL